MNCEHTSVLQGEIIPLRYGSACSELCCDCGIIIVRDWHGKFLWFTNRDDIYAMQDWEEEFGDL